MAKEFRQQEDLVKERRDLENKVAIIQAKKNEDIAKRIAEMERGREETKGLTGLLKEAEENVNYYKKLEETGQLPEDERENFAKAEGLVIQIKTKMAENNEVARQTMAIPEIKDRVMEGAEGINQGHNEEKEKQLKIKMMEEEFLQWIEKLNAIAEEINKKVEAEYAVQRKARENLIKKIDEVITVASVKEELKQYLNYPEDFKQKALSYKGSLGWTKFTEKKGVDSLINSDELREMEKALKHFKEFIEENNLKGRSIKNVKECSWAILHNNIGGVGDEIKKLYEQAERSPYINLRSVMDAVYKKNGYGEDKYLSVESINSAFRRY